MTKEAEARTVLIVDDDADLAESLADVLELKEHSVVTASNSEQASRLLDQMTPGIVLLDVRLGSEAGLDLLPDIRQRQPLVPIVIMTAHASADTAIQALQRGAFDYLKKPFQIPDLLATIDRAFEHAALTRDKQIAEQELVRTNSALARLNRRLRGLVESATRVVGLSGLDELINDLLVLFADHLGAQGGTLFRQEADTLRRVCTLDPPHVPEELQLPLRPDSLIAAALAEEKALLVANARSSGWTGYTDNSSLIFPITVDADEPELVVTLHNPVAPPFSDFDLELGTLLSSLIAEVIRNLRARGALRHQEALYRYLFERSHAVNIVLSSDGRIASLNQAALERLGYTANELVGVDPISLVVSDDSELAKRRLTEVLAETEGEGIELRIRAADGTVRMLYFPSGGGVVVHGPEEDPSVLITAIDVTERKREEHELFQASKLVSLGTLASGIAHEVNNPNSYIRMNAQNLGEILRRIGTNLPTDGDVMSELDRLTQLGHGLVEGVIEGSERIASLVGQLREFVREEPRSLEPEVDLNQVVNNAVALVGPLLSRATHSYELSLTENLPTVRGDSHQLEQVVMNLVSNACQAVEEQGGQITISTGTHDCEVFLAVNDDGPGIPEADLDRIMDPFFTTKRDKGGTGLGLSVSHRVVERHQGRLVFESNERAGTTATVWIPVDGNCS